MPTSALPAVALLALSVLPSPQDELEALHAKLVGLLDAPASGRFSCEAVGLDTPLGEEDYATSLAYAREHYLDCYVASNANESSLLDRMRENTRKKGDDFVPYPLRGVVRELRRDWTSQQLWIDWPYWRLSKHQPSPGGKGMISVVSTYDTKGRWEAQYSDTGELVSTSRLKTRDEYQRSTGVLMLFLRLELAAEVILEFGERDRTIVLRDGSLSVRANFQEMERHPALRDQLRYPYGYMGFPGWATIDFGAVGDGFRLTMNWYDCLGGRLQTDTMTWSRPESFPEMSIVSYAPGIEVPYDEFRVSVLDRSDQETAREPEFRWNSTEPALVQDERFAIPVAYQVEPSGVPPEDAELTARVDALLLDAGGPGLAEASVRTNPRPVALSGAAPAAETPAGESRQPAGSRSWYLGAGLLTSMLLVAVVLKK